MIGKYHVIRCYVVSGMVINIVVYFDLGVQVINVFKGFCHDGYVFIVFKVKQAFIEFKEYVGFACCVRIKGRQVLRIAV